MNLRDEVTMYTFKGQTGYVLHPTNSSMENELFALGHTESVPAWSDQNVHKHTHSEEYYVLLQGQLKFLIRDIFI